jgi:hypothetical protein
LDQPRFIRDDATFLPNNLSRNSPTIQGRAKNHTPDADLPIRLSPRRLSNLHFSNAVFMTQTAGFDWIAVSK